MHADFGYVNNSFCPQFQRPFSHHGGSKGIFKCFLKKALKVRIHRDIFKLIYSRHNLITLISYFALLQSLEACYIPVEACKIYFGVFCETDFFKVKAQKRTRVHQFNTTQKSEVACTFYILQKHHN